MPQQSSCSAFSGICHDRSMKNCQSTKKKMVKLPCWQKGIANQCIRWKFAIPDVLAQIAILSEPFNTTWLCLRACIGLSQAPHMTKSASTRVLLPMSEAWKRQRSNGRMGENLHHRTVDITTGQFSRRLREGRNLLLPASRVWAWPLYLFLFAQLTSSWLGPIYTSSPPPF